MSKSTKLFNKKDTVSEETLQREQLKTMKKMDVSHLKSQIYDLREQLKHLINQKIATQKDMQRRNEQFMSQSYELQRVNKSQEEEVIQLETKLNILRNTFSQAEIKNRNELSIEIKQICGKKEAEREQLRREYEGLQQKVGYLKKYKEREINYKETVRQLQERVSYLQYSHSRDVSRIRQDYENKRREIQSMGSRQKESIEQHEVGKLREKLSLEREMGRENQLMQQEIRLCQQEKLIVENECKLIGEEIGNNSSGQGKTVLEEQAVETYERSLRVIRLEGKMAKLKQFLAEEMQRLDQEMVNINKQYDQNEKIINEKIQKLKASLGLKERDYKKVKACSQMVLDQRSPLEAYLLEVFYQNSQLNYKDPFNVNQILRKLFVKINSKKTPLTYKQYLRQSEFNSTKKSQLLEKSEQGNKLQSIPDQ